MAWVEDEVSDEEGPSEADIARAERTAEVRCPACGSEVYEDAAICPQCGHAIEAGSGSMWRGRKWWWVVLAILGIVMMLLALGQVI